MVGWITIRTASSLTLSSPFSVFLSISLALCLRVNLFLTRLFSRVENKVMKKKTGKPLVVLYSRSVCMSVTQTILTLAVTQMHFYVNTAKYKT